MIRDKNPKRTAAKTRNLDRPRVRKQRAKRTKGRASNKGTPITFAQGNAGGSSASSLKSEPLAARQGRSVELDMKMAKAVRPDLSTAAEERMIAVVSAEVESKRSEELDTIKESRENERGIIDTFGAALRPDLFPPQGSDDRGYQHARDDGANSHSSALSVEAAEGSVPRGRVAEVGSETDSKAGPETDDETDCETDGRGLDSVREEIDGHGDRLMQRELAEAASGSGVVVNRSGDGPAVLEADAESPPPDRDTAASGETADPSAASSDSSGPAANNEAPASSAGNAAGPVLHSNSQARAPKSIAAGTAKAATSGALPTPAGFSTAEAAPAPAMVAATAAPQNALLSNDTPDAPLTQDAFLEVYESGNSEAQDLAHVRALGAQVMTHAEARKASMITEAAARKAEVLAAAEQHVGQLQGLMDAHLSQTQSQYAQARADIEAQASISIEDVRAQLAVEIAQIDATAEAQVTGAEGELEQRKVDTLAFIAEQQREPEAIAKAESARANGELDATIGESIAIGENEAGRRENPDAQAAARRVSAESAADIAAKKTVIEQDLWRRASVFAAKYASYSDKVNAPIEQAQASLSQSMRARTAQVKAELENGAEAAIQVIEDRARQESETLQSAENEAIHEIEADSWAAIERARVTGAQTAQALDSAANATISWIDASAAGTISSIEGIEEPYIPGVAELCQGAMSSISEVANESSVRLGELGDAGTVSLTTIVERIISKLNMLSDAVGQSTEKAVERGASAFAEIAGARATGARERITAFDAALGEMLADTVAELEPVLQTVRDEVSSLTEQFRTDIGPATDQSIAEARKPRTDPQEDRVREAADRAEESWISGLFRAVWDIAKGLVVLVLVALAVAAIAAVFGVLLTAWTAMMIAGGILLLAGLSMALLHRFNQPEIAEHSTGFKALLALSDTVGFTGVYQALGHDIATGEELSAGERTHGAVTGAFTMFMLFLGTRAAIRGPGSGGFTRNPNMPRGWVGWRNAIPSAWRGIRGVGVELYNGMRMGMRNIKEWVRQRLQRNRRPSGPGDADYVGPLDRTRPLVEDGMGHHMQQRVHAGMYSEMRTFDLARTPRYYPESNHPLPSQNAGHAHTRMHRALSSEGVPGNRAQTNNAGLTYHQLMELAHQGYANPGLQGIRGSLRTPNGDIVIIENATPLQAYNALLRWFGYGHPPTMMPEPSLLTPSTEDSEQSEPLQSP